LCIDEGVDISSVREIREYKLDNPLLAGISHIRQEFEKQASEFLDYQKKKQKMSAAFPPCIPHLVMYYDA
jgi:DNA primase large subunit